MNWKETLQKFVDTVINWATTAGVRLVIALIILFVSFKVINAIARKIAKSHEKGKIDKTLAKTFAYVFKLGLKIIVAICLVGYVGIDTSGLAALVASFGVCIGLAVNGAVANLAGGVLIIITRPFKVDDFIEAQGYSGTVEDIHITNTKLRTPDNKVVYVPNGALANGNIVNYSEKDIRRVDFSFTVAYTEDYENAKTIIRNVLESHPLGLKDPAPYIRVSSHSKDGVVITARLWANNGDYWTVNADVIESVKNEFDKAGIAVPTPRLNVQLDNK